MSQIRCSFLRTILPPPLALAPPTSILKPCKPGEQHPKRPKIWLHHFCQVQSFIARKHREMRKRGSTKHGVRTDPRGEGPFHTQTLLPKVSRGRNVGKSPPDHRPSCHQCLPPSRSVQRSLTRWAAILQGGARSSRIGSSERQG